MEKKNKIILLITAFFLVFAVGFSFAFFASGIFVDGDGSKLDAQTAQVENAIVHVEGNLEAESTENIENILPGHKVVNKIKVYATRDKKVEDFDINYNLVWKGTNSLNTPLKYTVYKTDNGEAEIDVTCEKDTQVLELEDGKTVVRYSEKCNLSSDTIDVEDVYVRNTDNHIIPVSEEEDTVTLVPGETITATENGEPVYYLIVVEYQNTNSDQSGDIDTNGFNGIVTVEVTEDSSGVGAEYILAKSKMGEGTPNFSKTSCSTQTDGVDDCGEKTVGLYCWDVDTNLQCTETTTNMTYFYRGDVTDNYVEFAGFYWRIIRINENGSLRLIYSGRKSNVDAFGKETILANGSENIDLMLDFEYTEGDNTYINSLPYNGGGLRYEYLGFMYTDNQINGNSTSSDIKNVLDKWYYDDLIEYTKYMDAESGFCGDRTYELSEYCVAVGSTPEECVANGGTWFVDYYYGAYTRLYNGEYTPTFDCPDSKNDLYTVNNIANIGNEKLTYPVGLITADEIVYAGGKGGNNSYYLYTGSSYWTITPLYYLGPNYAIAIIRDGSIWSGYDDDEGHSVRPVINLSPNVILSGEGTIDSPYKVVGLS